MSKTRPLTAALPHRPLSTASGEGTWPQARSTRNPPPDSLPPGLELDHVVGGCHLPLFFHPEKSCPEDETNVRQQSGRKASDRESQRPCLSLESSHTWAFRTSKQKNPFWLWVGFPSLPTKAVLANQLSKRDLESLCVRTMIHELTRPFLLSTTS